MARTKVTPKKGERGGETRVLRIRAAVQIGGKERRPPSPVHPSPPPQEAPPGTAEIMGRIVEAEQLEGVGRLPSSLPTQWVAQMAAEARPSTLGGEEAVSRKLQLTMGGKAPQKEFLQARK